MGNVYREEVVIKYHECGSGSILRLKDLLDYFQDVAALHADELGVGLESVSSNKELWVLSKLQISLSRDLRVGDRLTLVTYPTGVNGLYAERQYTMTDMDGNDVVKATSFWLLLDAVRFRPVRPADCLPKTMLDQCSGTRHFGEPEKIAGEVCGELRHVTTIRRNDIDENNHLNNAQYGRYITDIAAELTGKDVHFSDVSINYIHQALLGDVIECSGAVCADGSVYVGGRSLDGSVQYFRARVRVRP